jgi:hypothetical protein
MGNTFDDFIEYYNKNLETTKTKIMEDYSDTSFTITKEAVADVTRITQIIMAETLRLYHEWRLSQSYHKPHQHRGSGDRTLPERGNYPAPFLFYALCQPLAPLHKFFAAVPSDYLHVAI